MDSTNNNMKDFVPRASVTSIEDIDSEDVLHMCKFCDQSFSGLYQYNIHFVAKHLKDSLKSLNQTSMDKICREMSESNNNNSSKYSSPNFLFSQKELTDNVNERQVTKPNGKVDNTFKHEDLITQMKAIQSIQQQHNISYEYDSEIIAENNLNEPKTDTAYSPFATQNMNFSRLNDVENNYSKQKIHAADPHSTSFSEENDLKVKSGAHKYNVSLQRNNLISQSLSKIMESYSKVIGEEMELEVKIRVRPVKDNIVTHTYFNKEEIHSPHSSSVTAASSHSADEKSLISKNLTDFNHRNREIKSNVSHHLNKNVGSDFKDGFSSSSTERNALNSKESSEASICTSLSKCFQENSENESDILIIENPYVCKHCNSTFSQKYDLRAHLCSNVNKHDEDLTAKLPIRRVDRIAKNSDIFHITEKHIGERNPKVTIQFSCKMCKRVFYEEDKFEAHYCDVNDMHFESEYLTKKNAHPDEISVTDKSQKTFFSPQSNEWSGIPSQSSEQTSRSFPGQCVIKEITIDDPDICIIEEPYLCGVCKKLFCYRNELDMHSCTESKLIFPRTDKNQDLNHINSKSNDVDLQNVEHTENSTLKINKSAINNLFMTEDISNSSDVHFSKTHYSCNVCHNAFTDKNELNSHICPRAQEYYMEVDSNMKINVSLKNSTLGKRIKHPLLPGLPKNVKKNMPVNQTDVSKVVFPFYCDSCDTGFFRQVDLYVHLNICDYRNNITKETLRISNLGKSAEYHASEQQNKKSVIKSTAKDFTVTNSESDNIRKIQFTHMCHKCHEGFFEKSDFELHMCTHIENNNLFCIFCNEKFLLYSKLMEHFDIHRTQKLHFCFHCSKGFVEEKELKLHSAIHKIRQNYTCDICKKCFELERSIKGHICKYTISEPKKKQMLCQLCNHPFYSKLKLKKHLDMHKKKDSLTCSICSLSFEHILTLQKHLQKHANTRPYLCLICYRGCFDKRSFLKHLTSHSELRSYTCDICERSFAQRGHLLGHMKTHQLSSKKRHKQISYRCSLGKNC